LYLLQIKYVDFYGGNDNETEFYTTVFLAYHVPIYFKHFSNSKFVWYFEIEKKKSGTTNGNKNIEKQG